jgi:hypothetical protein
MDGVPQVTQPPVLPAGTFVYESSASSFLRRGVFAFAFAFAALHVHLPTARVPGLALVLLA